VRLFQHAYYYCCHHLQPPRLCLPPRAYFSITRHACTVSDPARPSTLLSLYCCKSSSGAVEHVLIMRGCLNDFVRQQCLFCSLNYLWGCKTCKLRPLHYPVPAKIERIPAIQNGVRGCLLQCTSWKLTCVLWEIRNEQCRHARRESHVDARWGKKVFQRDDLCAATSLSSINFATRGARWTTIVVALESLELIRKIGPARSRRRTEANCLPSSHYMVVVVGDVRTSGASRRAIHLLW
jgi:hypothetical protein